MRLHAESPSYCVHLQLEAKPLLEVPIYRPGETIPLVIHWTLDQPLSVVRAQIGDFDIPVTRLGTGRNVY